MKFLFLIAACCASSLLVMTISDDAVHHIGDHHAEDPLFSQDDFDDLWDESVFTSVETLEEAIEQCRSQLTARGRGEYSALITEAKWKAAIRTGLQSFAAEAPLKRIEGTQLAQRYNEAIPVFEGIVNDGVWPEGAVVRAIYSLTSSGVKYDGLALRLKIPVPCAPELGFEIPVLDVCYGRFSN